MKTKVKIEVEIEVKETSNGKTVCYIPMIDAYFGAPSGDGDMMAKKTKAMVELYCENSKK